MPASSCALARIFSVAFAIAAGAPADGRVEAVADAEAIGVRRHDLHVERGHAEVVGDELGVAGLLAVGAVVRLSTILPVGWTRRKTAR